MLEIDPVYLALQRRRRKNPKLARWLSFFVPGLGQLYNGQPLKALMYLTSLVLLVPWPFAVIDAYETAQRINQESAARALGIDPNHLPVLGNGYVAQPAERKGYKSLYGYNILKEAEAIVAHLS